MKLTFVDLFAGVGMARMGMEQAGFECVYTCEFDKHKRKEYEIIHGNEPEGCDIRDVRATDIPRSDVWFFGAPCQDFSIAGLRKGLGGDRSSLISEVFRLIEEKGKDKPTWLVYENVKGMLSSNGGRDFMSILLRMEELGYDVEWQTLNTKHFGLPQNRERVYTIGHLRTSGSKQILPITSTDGKNCHTKINIVGSTDPNRRIQQRKYIYGDDGLIGCMTATDYKEPKIVQVGRKEQRVFVKSNTVGGYEVAMIGDAINLAFPDSKTRRGRVGKEVAQTLDRSCNQGVFIQNGEEYVIRKLTPKECMRLQGVPDEYTDRLIQAGISDSQIYKAAGDGLSVPIAKEIGERIRKTYEESN